MHVPASGRRNRLATERSPYLLQHAANPVDWWPWGAEAIAEARRRDVPLFLSIGYATCHWCHVMARESFEDPAVAQLLAEHAVAVKVDREERPEVDEVYMAACQIFTHLVEGRPSGGWPLSAWLEPSSLKPFFVGTYFPPEPMHGRPSFSQAILSLGRAWRERRDEVVAQAKRLGSMVAGHLSPEGATASAPPPDDLAREAASRLMAMHDTAHGGFGGAPKFPQPGFLELLLEVDRGDDGAESRQPELLDVVHRTLASMAAGGIFDQAGGGFHRYTVDAAWTVPHFEKMLYDNGQLASLYARAAVALGDPRLSTVAVRTCDFVLREMTSPQGGFFSALDAEAEGREGEGYVRTRDAFERALRERGFDDDDVARAASAFGLDDGPNFRDPHDPDAAPSNVLVDTVTWSAAPPDERVRAMLDRVRDALLDARTSGPRPATDDKVIPAWNGLMIEGLAETASALAAAGGDVQAGARRFTDAAATAADFVLSAMRSDDGGLLRSWRNGAAGVPASLEDYAAMACGLLSLARLDADGAAAATRIAQAAALLDAAEARFADGRGGWFDAPQSELLFVRARSLDDGALPSGTTLMVEAHRRLAALDPARAASSRRRAEQAWHSALAAVAANPVSSAGLLASLLRGGRGVRRRAASPGASSG